MNQTLTVIMPRWCLRWVKKKWREKISNPQHIVLYCAIGGPFYLSQSDIYNVNGCPLKKCSIQVQLKKRICDGTALQIFKWLLKTSKYAHKQVKKKAHLCKSIDGTRSSIDILLRTEHKYLLVPAELQLPRSSIHCFWHAPVYACFYSIYLTDVCTQSGKLWMQIYSNVSR